MFMQRVLGFKRDFFFSNWQELQKDITCLAGFAHFHQQGFCEARDLFM